MTGPQDRPIDDAVVDALRTSVGGEFRKDSRLLLVDTPKLAAEMFGGPPPKDCGDCAGTPSAYEWRDDKWQAVPGFVATHIHKFQ